MAVTSQALLEPSGSVIGALGAIQEASWALLEPSGRRLERSGQRSADMLNSSVFLDVFL